MPPTIEDMLKKLPDINHAKSFFDSAFEKGDSRDLDILRGLLIDILFKNRDKAILIAGGQAFVFTCLKLAKNLKTTSIYKEMFACPKYVIGLGHRSRRYFDAFLEHPESLPLQLKSEDKNKIHRYMQASKRREKNFKDGEAKSQYFDQSRGAEWLKSIKELLWNDFRFTYLKLKPVPQSRRFADYREIFSLRFITCFICAGIMKEQDKIYVSQYQIPLQELPAKHPDAVGICHYCRDYCKQKKLAPVDEALQRNLRWDHMMGSPLKASS